MKHLVFTTLLICSFTLSIAQLMKKPSAVEISTLPQWAQLMYGDNPNMLDVRAAYHAYYKTHPFEKSYHTQYYKRWVRSYSTQLNDAGYIVAQAVNSNPKPSIIKSSSWSVVGPITT